ncbi:hypothetical protein BHMPCIPO_00162 [Ensifer sesbaniae]|nr:hypothetical protein [Ensifer sesbaniae]
MWLRNARFDVGRGNRDRMRDVSRAGPAERVGMCGRRQKSRGYAVAMFLQRRCINTGSSLARVLLMAPSHTGMVCQRFCRQLCVLFTLGLLTIVGGRTSPLLRVGHRQVCRPTWAGRPARAPRPAASAFSPFGTIRRTKRSAFSRSGIGPQAEPIGCCGVGISRWLTQKSRSRGSWPPWDARTGAPPDRL